jgi:hypothetical protein
MVLRNNPGDRFFTMSKYHFWCITPSVRSCRGSVLYCLAAVEWDGSAVLLCLSSSEHLTDSGAGFWPWLGTFVGPEPWLGWLLARAPLGSGIPPCSGQAPKPCASVTVACSGLPLRYRRSPRGRAIWGLPSHLFVSKGARDCTLCV